MNLDGRVIIVSGCGGTLGEACARELARLDARLVVHDLERTAAEHRAAELRKLGAESIAWSGTLHGGGAVDLVAAALTRFGSLDGVVNADLGDSSVDVLDRHLCGTIALTAAALAVIAPDSPGRIVGFGSGAGVFGSADQPLRAAAAAGVVGHIRSISLALRDTRIRANVISPIVSATPLPDACMARSIAPAVAFFCHCDCALNGELWSVGHGRFATIFSGTAAGCFEPEPGIDTIAENLDSIRATDHAVYPRRAEDERLLVEV